MVDPIADMLTRVRNAFRSGHPRVEIPHSRHKMAIAQVLKKEGYVGEITEIEKGGFKAIRIVLRYDDEGKGYLSGITMISKPGKRVYAGHEEIPLVMGGLGVNIISTPRGVMSGAEARKTRVGGEILCNIW